MARFRYVTPALHGQWWSTRDEALADALRAKQARRAACDDSRVELLEYARLQEDVDGKARGGLFPYADPLNERHELARPNEGRNDPGGRSSDPS